ncbi:CHAT domain-containing protein [Talaromyces proteolyticus]|uniref:CHAT domain-containing protein n=1 Tax=Talaromyces proteolyticus TaxID=1131652 RepID=A0AAD4Q057_9EURO|nr:CHAT domain-containing protein [Talaromyces proteolyticus]KAH8697307.1 CHAT domain-containing protein [Talaromyces proteolyticus]
MYLNDLGVPLYDRFLRMGVIDDLEECIRITGQAVGMTPDYHPKQAMYSSNLGVYLNNRYLRIGTMADLEAAIRLARQAVDATPRYSPDWAGRLHNLENYLRRRYSRRRTIADLEESIQIARKTVDATPEDHPNRAIYLDGLGYALSDRYAKKGVIADQEEAMRLARQAVNATPIDSTLWAPRLGILGTRLMVKYLRTRETADVEESIRISRQAVEATPEDHPQRASLLMTLVKALAKRRSRTGATADTIKEITAHLQSVLRQRNAEVITRIQAARAVLPACASTLHWEQAYEVANVAISLVPKLTPRSLENSDKQHVLRQVAGVASDAAALALQAGKGALVALDFLEQGRGILATSLEEMRTDTLSLRYRYPDLAERFAQLRNELELSDTRDTSFLDQSSWQTQGSRRYDAGNELDKVIVEIRKQSGFEDFLTAPSEKEMQAAAASGPIVVINVSKYRCDSVLIEKHQIRVLALPLLNIKEIKNRAQRLIQGSLTTLEWLWNVAASPILDALGFVQPPTADNWPHVWWITTGPLSTFPLHAAGLHSSGFAETVLDRVISSYSLSIKTIIRSRSRHIPLQGPARAILVAMQNTPEHSRLPFAAREVAVLHDICKLTGLDPIKPPRRKQDVIQHLPNCKIFHFAGHGYTDATNPSHSHMLLEDWKTDPLTVATLLEMNLNESSPFLAYLSAYGTGQIKNDRLVDESIHLISACQLAGFRHVIGTLWEVNDELCVDMARITYESMRNGNMTDISVRRGLHNATRELRDRWLLRMSSKVRRGSRSVTMVDVSFVKDTKECRRANYVAPKNDGLPRDAVLCDDDGYDDDDDDDGDDEGIESLHWVPYVHFGV